MNIFFTSDCHFGHYNIIRYCNRPFKTLKDMDNTIIKNINERVKEDDMLFHIGDFCFSHSSEASQAPKKPFIYYRNQINCRNIIFLRGNHDKNNSVKTHIESLVLNYGGQLINLTHRPEHASEKYNLNFVGHVHEKWNVLEKIIKNINITLYNVGVDVNNFYPVTFNEIMSKLSRWRKQNENKII